MKKVLFIAAAVVVLATCKKVQVSASRGSNSPDNEEYAGTGEAAAVSGTNLTDIGIACDNYAKYEVATTETYYYKDCRIQKCKMSTCSDAALSDVPSDIRWSWEEAAKSALFLTVSCGVSNSGLRKTCFSKEVSEVQISASFRNMTSRETASVSRSYMSIKEVSPGSVSAFPTTLRISLKSPPALTRTPAATVNAKPCSIIETKVDIQDPYISCTMSSDSAGKHEVAVDVSGEAAKSSVEISATSTSSNPTATPTRTSTPTPTPTPTNTPSGCAPPFQLVFATSSTYVVPFGPDGECSAAASASAVSAINSRTWKALIGSNGGGSGPGPDGYVVNKVCMVIDNAGTTVQIASNSTDMFDGSIALPIKFNENGSEIMSNYAVWTGLNIAGQNSATCSGWSDNGPGNAVAGEANQSGNGWIMQASPSCNSGNHRIYCLSDP